MAAVLALAFVMNTSGQTVTLGLWLAGAGGIFAFLSAFIGWLGVAVTGSDTSSNSLFGALQVAAAKDAGLSPALMAAANSSGGVLGKMISPQNLAIGAAAVGMAGREGDIFRVVLNWSLLLVILMAVLVYLQSTPVPELDAAVSDPVPGVEIDGPRGERFDEILTADALEFVARLHREFDATRRELLAARVERQARARRGRHARLPGRHERRARGRLDDRARARARCRTAASRSPGRRAARWSSTR